MSLPLDPSSQHAGSGIGALARRALPVLASLALAGCADNGAWAWHTVSPLTAQGQRNLSFLIDGFTTTIAVAVTAALFSVMAGTLVALCGFSRLRPLRLFNRVYVELLRAAPVLVVLLWVFYGLPVVVGLRLDVFTAAVIALALCDSPFEAEILRGGIQSIDRGQREAALSLGLTEFQAFRTVVLPQAIRRVLPPIGNQFVYLVKMSSLASVIGATDLTRKANELVVTVFRPLEIYTVLIVEYLVLVLAVSWAVRALERRMAAGDRPAGGQRSET